ncbi:acyl-ACP--UDP-N-acetylglucosamine O-acyltransferase [Candidatus Methylospira mobilis]|uniref:Acyl-[acyl-carrier-protein]--UDP-N-acetylglucosamine O-acyltransferase n=1 Tax=Candidatus Methylospira mobilis TaxID=1808979 RepID=A0A5Q0BJM0_9GAMM|nr:acyl-ACP--UDP-N-acetylglucosamine O-acyltransferase [Candidatus Methylospira mobilis]QFY44003.1 acyl-ACP--UDP-N-acetylglucosamine O-acyltransferase [Candidatus Methylospira mobilis]WNV05007.1 acyl-ACP--UDP-N-acetylglucosamine O-acyltransferase [Candidatus Methylospira mobilis]
MIHPSAIIDPAALVDEGVDIGPFSIVGAGVEIGAGTRIGPHVVLKGPTRIGKDNQIFQFSSVGEDPQDKKYHGEVTRLEIGERNVIREYCTIHRGTVQDQGVTHIGSDNLFMAYTHIAHDCVIGNHVIMANAASLAGHVHMADHVILGGFSLVHQFCKLGVHSFSAMGSVISRDIPPYVMVGGRPTRPHGINSVGLERKGYDADALRAIRKAYKLIYKSGLTLDDAIKSLDDMAPETPAVSVMADFLKNTERSIIR